MNKNYSDAKYAAINDNENQNSLNFLELCTAFYYQYLQIVDLLIQYYRQLMNGLNPYALPYVLS